MANVRSVKDIENLRKKVMHAAATLFLTRGFNQTTVKEISAAAGVSTNTIFYEMKSKDEMLVELVMYVLEGQFQATAKMLNGITDDKILFYAAETTLQLHMAESSEYIRELYGAAYSLPKSTEYIQKTITGKLEEIFKEHLPHLETKDFYELEVASGGIMRGFMTIPCNMYFTMERKVRRYLETTLLVFRVPDEKINESITFVSQFDFTKIAADVIQSMIEELEKQTALI
ncbi:MAG: TetR/AcrR family transcriptional regulator [Lachnospiraceae bacterium]|nr:TetR/AcrR family transcriptional regulator [Lachnospiraceae bacterium]